MRYPVANSTQDFQNNWYNPQPFGVPTSYGFHEGEDYNKRTGGDTDLGEPLYAVADGIIVYFHNASHPTTGFGRHMVLECNTYRGKRWYMYSHCQEITAENKFVTEGQVIGRLGKSGNSPLAHLHFSTFKVDPSTLPQGIDTIAKTSVQLNSWWERFELLPSGATMSELLTYLNRTNDTDAIRDLGVLLGTTNGKCDWGDASDNKGGDLGAARREITIRNVKIHNQDTEIIRLNKIISEMPPVTEPGYTPTGKITHINSLRGVVEWEEISYKKD